MKFTCYILLDRSKTLEDLQRVASDVNKGVLPNFLCSTSSYPGKCFYSGSFDGVSYEHIDGPRLVIFSHDLVEFVSWDLNFKSGKIIKK